MQSTMQVFIVFALKGWRTEMDHMLIMDYDEDWFAVENRIVRI